MLIVEAVFTATGVSTEWLLTNDLKDLIIDNRIGPLVDRKRSLSNFTACPLPRTDPTPHAKKLYGELHDSASASHD